MKSTTTRFIAIVTLLCWLTAWSAAANANVYTVTNTTDAAAGSLRVAITSANSHSGLDTIKFNIYITIF